MGTVPNTTPVATVPATQPAPSGAPSTPVTPANSGLAAKIIVKSTWQTGYCADIVVTNNGTAVAPTWTAVINLHGGRVSQKWNTVMTQVGGNASFAPSYSWATSLPAGATVSNQGFCVDADPKAAKATVVSVQ